MEFIPVWLVVLRFAPCFTIFSSYSFFVICIYVKPWTNIPVFGSSLIYKPPPYDVNELEECLIGDCDRDYYSYIGTSKSVIYSI